MHPTGHESRFEELSQDATKEKQMIMEHSVVWKNLPLEMSGVVLDQGDPISVIRFRSVSKDLTNGAKINYHSRLPSGTPALITSGLCPERVDIDNEDDHGGSGLHDIGCPERDVDNEDKHGDFGLHDVVKNLTTVIAMG